MGYDSHNSAVFLLNKLACKGYIKRKSDGSYQLIKNAACDESRAQTIDVPLVGTVACGTPILAVENIEGMFPISTRLAKPSNRYFLLRAQGNSMNKRGINDGDMVLVRQQNSAKNGDMVVALIDDDATIKEYHKSRDTIVLLPRSTEKDHKPIVLTDDFLVQGVVITSFQEV